MTTRSDDHYTVALLGFSDFERSALSSFFRLATARTPAYIQGAGVAESDFIIADADHPAALRAAMDTDRPEDTVYVGAQAPRDAWFRLPRPIEPTHIVRELDAMVERRRAHTVALLDINPPSAPSASEMKSIPAGSLPILPDLLPFEDDPIDGPDVLVAEDSRIARRFMQLRLRKLGYRVHLASDGDEVLELITQHTFRLVFLDVGLGDAEALDGFALCQHLKQHPDLVGDAAPRIVIVTGLSGATDRVRGTLAGCDAYLTKPVKEADLLKVLQTLDPGFERHSHTAESMA